MMSFKKKFFSENCFPAPKEDFPFGETLNDLFFEPDEKENRDFPIHGPNTIRFIEALVSGELKKEPGLLRGNVPKLLQTFNRYFPEIRNALEMQTPDKQRKMTEFLKVATLFHDIGKVVRRPNHPPLGANWLRHYDDRQRQELVDSFVYEDEEDDIASKYSRFSLLASIIHHHDKFGLVTTGEGGLPVFSDILYFTSDSDSIEGIKKNITSVMIANLSDIAAVCTASSEMKDRALKIAKEVKMLRLKSRGVSTDEERECLQKLLQICKADESYLGLEITKVSDVFEEWKILMDLVDADSVRGNRIKLKHQLLEIERNPARAIKRVLRLLRESAIRSNCEALVKPQFISLTSVESVLVGTLGAYQFQSFCELLATVAKMDYGLHFFKAIVCTCVRKKISPSYTIIAKNKKENWNELSENEKSKLEVLDAEQKSEIANNITALFVKIIEALLNRYIGILGYLSVNDPRRFGFQMRSLVLDHKVRDIILEFLCIKEHRDPIALTWLAEEVTIWSMD